MTHALAGLALLFALAAADPPAPAVDVRPVLKEEAFPWYDADTGRVKPILPVEYRSPWLDKVGEWASGLLDRASGLVGRLAGRFRWLNRWKLPGVAGAGDLVMVGLLLLLLTVVLVILLELLRRYRPIAGDKDRTKGAVIRAGGARSIEGLPAGVRLDTSDPWAEAQRLRARGDFAGAVVHLFAHQLVTLDRHRLVRLVPGRTGRQLVRGVADRQVRGLVEPTLRLFEAVYYGHRAPSAEAFEPVWALAIQFQNRLGAGAAT